jgi:hypothetical protein
MRLLDKPLLRTLFVSQSDKDGNFITLHPDNKVMVSEKTMSSTSDTPYIASFSAIKSFLRNNDYTDSVVSIGLNVPNYQSLVQLFDRSEKLRLVTYTVGIKSCNLGFFAPQIKALISFDDYLGLLRDKLPPMMKLYYHIKENTGYVIIEKN